MKTLAMKSGKSTSLAFRVSLDKAKRLEELAAATDRPRSWLLEQALDQYLDLQAWQVEQVELAISEMDAGQGIPHEEIKEWLLGWGRDGETSASK